ncbi:MAG: hypothetical protein SFT68_05275 [Rickettsiaceae bacterium]|nr:hypothetical protein [Rickettsiaceae bacterium]
MSGATTKFSCVNNFRAIKDKENIITSAIPPPLTVGFLWALLASGLSTILYFSRIGINSDIRNTAPIKLDIIVTGKSKILGLCKKLSMCHCKDSSMKYEDNNYSSVILNKKPT